MPKYVLNSFLAGLLSVTFSITPFAMAEDKSPVSVMKSRVKQLKLETTKTYPELFARMAATNSNVNPVVFRQLAATLQGEKFPKTQVQEFKYKGKDALKVINQIGGEQVVVEFLFYGDEVLKVNGIVFNKKDVATNDAFTAKALQVPAYAKAYKAFRKKSFAANSTPTFQQWTRLTKAQRAEYHMRYRELLEAAYKVHNTKTFKVTSNSPKSFDQWVQEIMLGDEAYAETGAAKIGSKDAPAGAADTVTPPPGTTATVGAEKAKQEAAAVKKAKSFAEAVGYNQDTFRGEGEEKGPSCIVAGYAREWKGDTCPWNGGSAKGQKEFYEKFPISKECQSPQTPNHIACNPIIYGFNSDGKAHCIDTTKKDASKPVENFNFATHGNGPCEKVSPLNSASDKMSFIKNIMKRGDIPGSDTLSLRKNAKGQDELVTSDKVLFEKILKELQSPLNSYIESAKKICEVKSPATADKPADYKYKEEYMPPKGGKSPKKDVAHQHQACDALMKRAIAVQNLLAPPDVVTVTIAPPCEGWAPPECVEEITVETKKVCGCKNKTDKPDPNAKTCTPIAVKPKPEPGKPEPVAGEPVADIVPGNSTPGADCTSFFSRMNPTVSECSSTMGDWIKTIGGVLVAVCVGEMAFEKEVLGMCYDKPKELKPPVYIDPVCPKPEGCNGPVGPVTPPVIVVPPGPPREETNQNAPPTVINPKVIPVVR